MKKAIIIFLVAGVVIALVTFTVNPFRRRTGLIVVFLGIIAGFTIRLTIGLSMVGIGILLLVIQFIYHRYC